MRRRRHRRTLSSPVPGRARRRCRYGLRHHPCAASMHADARSPTSTGSAPSSARAGSIGLSFTVHSCPAPIRGRDDTLALRREPALSSPMAHGLASASAAGLCSAVRRRRYLAQLALPFGPLPPIPTPRACCLATRHLPRPRLRDSATTARRSRRTRLVHLIVWRTRATDLARHLRRHTPSSARGLGAEMKMSCRRDGRRLSHQHRGHGGRLIHRDMPADVLSPPGLSGQVPGRMAARRNRSRTRSTVSSESCLVDQVACTAINRTRRYC